MTETDYTAKDITVLEGLEPVRLRPGMYIGSTGLGGLHGVGVSVVNALAERFVAEVRRDGHVYRQEFERGNPVGEMETVREMEKDEPTGTTIWYLPDSEIFETLDIEAGALTQRLRE